MTFYCYLFIAFEVSWKKSAFQNKKIKMLINGYIQIV